MFALLTEETLVGLILFFTVLMGVAVFRAMVRKPLALGPLYTLVRERPVTLAQLRQVPQPHRVLHNPMTYRPLNRSAAPACMIPAHQDMAVPHVLGHHWKVQHYHCYFATLR